MAARNSKKEKENNDRISVYRFQHRAAPQRKITALMRIIWK